jgi:hypothetical protein
MAGYFYRHMSAPPRNFPRAFNTTLITNSAYLQMNVVEQITNRWIWARVLPWIPARPTGENHWIVGFCAFALLSHWATFAHAERCSVDDLITTFRGVRWTKSVTVPRFLFHTSPMAVFDLVAQKQGWIVAACALVAFLQPYSRGSWYLNLLNGLYTSSLFAVIFNIWPFLLCKSFYSVP